MKCVFCKPKKDEVIVHNKDCLVLVPRKAFLPGHIVISPIKHFHILERIDNNVLEECADQTLKIFKKLHSLGVPGTNLLIQNGIPAGQTIAHFSINILMRSQDDGLNMDWQPKDIPPDEIEVSYQLIKQELENIKDDEPLPDVEEEKTESKVLKDQLRRIP